MQLPFGFVGDEGVNHRKMSMQEVNNKMTDAYHLFTREKKNRFPTTNRSHMMGVLSFHLFIH
jgi:hypothetical protein